MIMNYNQSLEFSSDHMVIKVVKLHVPYVIEDLISKYFSWKKWMTICFPTKKNVLIWIEIPTSRCSAKGIFPNADSVSIQID